MEKQHKCGKTLKPKDFQGLTCQHLRAYNQTMSHLQKDSQVQSNCQNSVKLSLEKITTSEVITLHKLQTQAVKLLLKFVESYNKIPYKFLTIAEVRRTFRTVGTVEANLIVGEFEHLGIVVGKISKAQFVYKFNGEFLQKTDTFGTKNINRIEEMLSIRRNKRVEYAKKILQEEGVTTLEVSTVKDDLQRAKEEPEYFSRSTGDDKLTALELHQLKQCNSSICRLCALEQNSLQELL